MDDCVRDVGQLVLVGIEALTVEVLTSLDELGRIASAWDSLVFSACARPPELSHAWVSSYLNVYTIPEERLKGLILICFKKQLEHNHARGCHNILGTISAFNTESLRAHFRMGFRICGETVGVTVAGLSVCYYRSWPHPIRRVHVFFKRPTGELKTV